MTLVLSVPIVEAADVDPHAGSRPVAVLIETDPWLNVIGSDTPVLAVYKDGQVLCKKTKRGNSLLFHTQLSRDSLEQIKKRLTTLGNYSTLKSFYQLAPLASDMPQVQIYLSVDGLDFVTTINGLRLPDDPVIDPSAFVGEHKPDTLPKLIDELCLYLTSLGPNEAEIWEPENVEVLFWGFDNALKSFDWPADWPVPDSLSQPKQGDLFRVSLPGKDLPRLRKILANFNGDAAVTMGGYKWSVAWRYSFPCEEVWNKALYEKAAR